ncbi:hypothetical protein PVK06_030386 [Gossypium arboreum]|uniref:Uncharacterized protein n=1 Tax=Gossypium arboreum TaxID=29729 RepID=A0ABR0NP81_GOSAR|nr:hypothetical protein PVK06_030386 [Gossypium arboreum]
MSSTSNTKGNPSSISLFFEIPYYCRKEIAKASLLLPHHSYRRTIFVAVASSTHLPITLLPRSAYFPSLITSLCLRARVKTQANLKGRYVQGCISTYDLERLVERVHELNQGEQEESTKPDNEESIDETKTEANLVTGTEEEESEPNSPKPVEASENPEPRVELEEEPYAIMKNGMLV